MLNDRIAAARQITKDLHAAEDAVDEAIVKIANLVARLPAARRQTNMSAIVGQDAFSKITKAISAAGEVRQMLTDAHHALSETQKQVGLGTRMFGAGVAKPPSAQLDQSNDEEEAVETASALRSVNG